MTGRLDQSTVGLDETTYERLQDRVNRSEFDTVSSYVDYVMTALLEELEGAEGNDGDDDEVRARLEDLGYLE